MKPKNQNRPQSLADDSARRAGSRAKPEKATARLLPCNHDRDQKITPVAVAAVMAGRADEFYGHAGVNCLHHGLVEAMQVIGDHANDSLLVCTHGR
jgi:hypothetical protein